MCNITVCSPQCAFRAVRKSLMLNDSLINELPGIHFGAHICSAREELSIAAHKASISVVLLIEC